MCLYLTGKIASYPHFVSIFLIFWLLVTVDIKMLLSSLVFESKNLHSAINSAHVKSSEPTLAEQLFHDHLSIFYLIFGMFHYDPILLGNMLIFEETNIL